MRRNGFSVLAATALAAASIPLLADEAAPAKPAVAEANDIGQAIKTANTRHVEILTSLVAKVPEAARGTLEKAITAAREGGDKAVAALSDRSPGEVGVAAPSSSSDRGKSPESKKIGEPGKPSLTGLQHARVSLADGFDKSEATLQGLTGQVPPETDDSVEAALGRLRITRSSVLQKLDSLIVAGRPVHHTPQRHVSKPPSDPPPGAQGTPANPGKPPAS